MTRYSDISSSTVRLRSLRLLTWQLLWKKRKTESASHKNGVTQKLLLKRLSWYGLKPKLLRKPKPKKLLLKRLIAVKKLLRKREAPAEEPVAESSEEAPAEEAVAESSEETPAEEPVAESSEEAPAEEPVAESSEEAPAEEPVAESSEEAPAKEPAEESSEEVAATEPEAEKVEDDAEAEAADKTAAEAKSA